MNSLPSKTQDLSGNQKYQDAMVELRVAAVKARWSVRALLAACCCLAALSAGLGVKVAFQAAPPVCVSTPVVQRGINPEEPRKLIDQANQLQKGKSQKKAVPVRNGAKVKTTWT